MPEPFSTDSPEGEQLGGFRLQRLEIYNWGTFDGRIWTLEPGGRNSLLTGEIGSGKSTLVDAVTTLLAPPKQITYNKAAGAESRERSLRSYVLGYYKTERSQAGEAGRPVALRDRNSYSVLLAVFCNAAHRQTVSLAQVFWIKDPHSAPERFYVASQRELSIASDFAGFGSDIADLRTRLRKGGEQIFRHFTKYEAWFRRRFNIGRQALDLFLQTVSMKSVGNLTDFVRSHMLEPFDVTSRIDGLIEHFDDLTRAHEAVLKAKDQVQRLTPLVADCDRHAGLLEEVGELRACREALKPYFDSRKEALLEERTASLAGTLEGHDARVARLAEKRSAGMEQERELRAAIAENGGDRLERIAAEVRRQEEERARRKQKADRYAQLAEPLGFAVPREERSFLGRRRELAELQEACADREARIQNERNEAGVELVRRREEEETLQAEIRSLKERRSNISSRLVELRGRLCRDLDLPEGELPFAGELIQVRDDQRRWEGAVERLLHSFGLSLLVPDRRYVQVAQWVDRTDLRGRLVYFRVRGGRREPRDLRPDSLVRKIVVNPDSPFSEWLEREIAARFDIACCDNPEVFRRETDAITPAGQIKRGGKRHEKDDRHRIDDRSRYILGWSNEAKIAALERDAAAAHRRTREVETQLQGLQRKQQKERARFDGLSRLAEYRDFRELDWRTPVLEIRRLEEERRQLEESSDILQRLNGQLQRLEERLAEDEERLEKARDKRSRTAQRYGEAQRQLEETKARTAETEGEHRERFGRVAALLPEALGDMTLTVERCDDAERTVRAWLQNRIDSVDRRAQSLRDRIIDAMRSYCTLYPLDTEETDVAIEAAGEYRAMLERLREDDLPRFRGALQGAFEREHHPRGGQLPGPAGQTAGDHQGADRPDQPLPHRHRLQSGALHRP